MTQRPRAMIPWLKWTARLLSALLLGLVIFLVSGWAVASAEEESTPPPHF